MAFSLRRKSSLISLFEINFTFLIRPFFYMNKKSRQKFNALRATRNFKVKWKWFYIFNRLSVAKNCLRPESAPLKLSSICCKILNMRSTILWVLDVMRLILFGIKIFFVKLGQADEKGRFQFILLKKAMIEGCHRTLSRVESET